MLGGGSFEFVIPPPLPSTFPLYEEERREEGREKERMKEGKKEGGKEGKERFEVSDKAVLIYTYIVMRVSLSE